MRIFPFKALLPAIELLESPAEYFPAIRDMFPEFCARGMFAENAIDAVYIYQQQQPEYTFNTIVAGVDIRELQQGNLVPHERTLHAKRQKSRELLLERKAMIKPVLLTYRDSAPIQSFVRRNLDLLEPLMLFELDETIHTIYRVSDESEITGLQEEFSAEVDKAYIADGHHRCAVMHDLFEEDAEPGLPGLDSMLAAFISFEEVVIHEYNRVVDLTGKISLAAFRDRLQGICEIEHLGEAEMPSAKHIMTMYLDDNWYRLRWRPEILRKYDGSAVIFDATLFNREVLGGIAGIADVANDDSVRYVEGTRGPQVIEQRTHSRQRVAFCLYPVQIHEVVQVTDSGVMLPPKSTWFEPRMLNGIVSKSI